jgi:hypothetical protein
MDRWIRLSEREKLRLLAGRQIINPSASSTIACDVSAIGIRQDRVAYGGANISGIRGIVGKQFDSVQEWDPIPQ